MEGLISACSCSLVTCLDCSFLSGLMTAVFRACGKIPERRDVFTICRRSEAKQFETFLQMPVGRISRQQEEVFRFPEVRKTFSDQVACSMLDYRFRFE